MNKVYAFILVALLSVTGLMISSCSDSEKNGEIQTQNTNIQPLKNQTVDAFSGDPINMNLYEDYKGKRVYFCCISSKNNFDQNPQRYLDEYKRLGVLLKDTPKRN